MSDSPSVDAALQQLQTAQGPLLDKIDELRTIGVGGLVGLPQLIVCGNQSSGKNSVLEAISRVILRRHPVPRFKVSIEARSSREKRTEQFSPTEATSRSQLESIVEKAKEFMGIGAEGFTDDILRVEVSGPDQPELTLVDLPGLYTSHSSSQDQQGIQVVRDITERYMRNARSIILAVVSAKNYYHNQGVLNMAEKFDQSRQRTIGILTQPDTLDVYSDEEAF